MKYAYKDLELENNNGNSWFYYFLTFS
jgi:hypothetical protein